MDLVSLWHVGSSRTRGRTCVSCIGRRILHHCISREVILLEDKMFPLSLRVHAGSGLFLFMP